MAISATESRALIISWTVTDQDVTVENLTLDYQNNTACFNSNESDVSFSIDGNETMFNITGLEEATEYSITVTAILSDEGSGGMLFPTNESVMITGTTLSDG